MNDIENAIKHIKERLKLAVYGGSTAISTEVVYLALNALEKQLNGDWIPVSEKLPQNNEHVLLLLKDEKGKTAQVVGYLYSSENEKFKQYNNNFSIFDGDEIPEFLIKEYVKAWMPLPESIGAIS